MIIRIGNKTFDLRVATQGDARFCFALSERTAAQYSNEKYSFERYKNEFIPSDARIVCHNGRRIGFIEFQEKKDGWYLWDLHLSRNYRGRGLGSKLLAHMHNLIENKGGKKITLYVFAKNPAVELYKRFGYRVTSKKLKDSRIRMVKKIR